MPILLAPIESTPYIGGNVPGDLSVLATGLQHVRKNNLAASTAPAAGDDSEDGYEVGSLWIDTTGDDVYLCVDATAGAAVWADLSAVTVPAGTGTEIQYRSSATAFGSVAGSSWDGTTLTVPGLASRRTGGDATAGYLYVVGNVTANNTTLASLLFRNEYLGTQYTTCSIIARRAAASVDGGIIDIYTSAGGSPVPRLTLGHDNGVTSATPAAGHVKAVSGSGTNVAGANLYLDAGQGTGSAVSGNVVIRTAAAGTSGTALNALVDRFLLTSAGRYGFGGYTPGTGVDFDFTFDTASNAPLILRLNQRLNTDQRSAVFRASTVSGATTIDVGVHNPNITGGPRGWIETSAAVSELRISALAVAGIVTAYTNSVKRLTISDAGLRSHYAGSDTYYTDFAVSAAGNLTITPSGGTTTFTGSVSGVSAGTGTELQYNNAGVMGAVTNSAVDVAGRTVVYSVKTHSGSGTAFSYVSIGAYTTGIGLASGATLSWTANASDAATTGDLILRRATAAKLQLGSDSATPIAQAIGACNGSGTNVAGANLYLDAGQGTGSAAGGNVVIRTAPAGTSGSGLNALVDVVTITTSGVIQVHSTGTVSAPSLVIGPYATYGFYKPAPSQIALAIGGSRGYLFDYYTFTLAATAMTFDGSARIGANTDLSLDCDTNSNGSGHYVRITTNAGAIEIARFLDSGRFGINTTAPDKQVEINSTTGDCLRLTYNDANGSATYYADFAVSAAGNLTITPSGTFVAVADAKNLSFGTTTGTKIGTATNEKIAFWNATPIVQPTTSYAEATLVQNSGDAINDNSTFDGYTLRQVVAALRGMGALA